MTGTSEEEPKHYDVLENIDNKVVKCLDHGHVTLVDAMPRLVPVDRKTADYAIVQAARVSYGDGTKTINEDRGLIRYLMRHMHTTPFEMIEFKFHCKMPLFVARQWIRHRTANVNEYSGRYSVMKDEFYIPEQKNLKKQSQLNKQGGDESFTDATQFLDSLNSFCDTAYESYEKVLASGLSREQARMILPVNNYTEWYWKIDLHNLFHFLALRCDSHAQWEIRVFADAILNLIQPIVPIAVEAWNDYHDHRSALKLTRLEIESLKNYIQSLQSSLLSADKIVPSLPELNSNNKREKEEWLLKSQKFGISEIVQKKELDD
jgi:thymidylate synthase (FAD)